MDELEKYIKDNYKRSGEAELRKELVSQGYRPEDFEGYFAGMKKNGNSRKIFYIVLGLIIVVAILVKIFIVNPMGQDTGVIKDKVITESREKYSSDPKDWVSEDSVIDVPAATNGSGSVDSSSIQYADGPVMTAFTYDGYYQGDYFTNSFDKDGKTLIEITSKLNATDGIPQIIIAEKIDKDTRNVTAMIFVDEDWKKQIVPTYIRWGMTYEKVKMFDYSNSPKSGIYMDTIDDSGRFSEGFEAHFGGITVGDVTQDKIDSDNNNVTYAHFR